MNLGSHNKKRIKGDELDRYSQDPQGYGVHLLPWVVKAVFLKFNLKDELGLGKSREF